ncbi:MAG TPA: DUF4249 domain-containing protein [Flavisolibacter sp.]|nr:DUF4249 domain-containing protein [Flavisolibacter sp.]
MRPVFIVLIGLLGILYSCKQPYEPPAVKANYNFLVVDGTINASPDSRTQILLSRTRNLTDTFVASPELNAQVRIEGKGGGVYNLAPAGNGAYSIEHLTLNPDDQYRLRITTADGTRYASQYVAVKKTPPIDSLTWEQNKDVEIFVNTHDPENKARYYKWDFEETYEYNATEKTILGEKDGLIFIRDTSNQIYTCWKTNFSTDLNLGSSINLSQDVINHARVHIIPDNSEKIGIRYSILVKQYALTEDAFRYFQILQKNTQQLGSIFDAQPSQLKSNIINESNTSEPVIGFVHAAFLQTKRLFITKYEVTNWIPVPEELFCRIETIPQDPDNFLIYKFQDTSFRPWYFVTGGIILNKGRCLDCTMKGGVNQKPAYW